MHFPSNVNQDADIAVRILWYLWNCFSCKPNAPLSLTQILTVYS